MKKTRLFLTALFSFPQMLLAEQFISLTLCSDRLLAELARPEQIAAQSVYSKNPLMMLDKINHDKPALEPRLTALLPYLDKTILLNETFYPQLAEDLKKLGVKIIDIQDNPQTPEQLFALMLQLGQRFQNEEKAKALVAHLKKADFTLHKPLKQTLILSDTGVIEPTSPQYKMLLTLLGLSPLKTPLNPQNFSLEKLLLAQPNWLIMLTDKTPNNSNYNEQAEMLNHPLLSEMFPPQRRAAIPLKYSYCFDQGVWQGAALIARQLMNSKEKE